MDNFDNTWNDGKWHSVEFILGRDTATTTIDNEPMKTQSDGIKIVRTNLKTAFFKSCFGKSLLK